MRREEGFTLIELMIVLAIIIILAAVGIGQYKKYTERAKAKQLVELARNCFMDLLAECQLKDKITNAPENCNLSKTKYFNSVTWYFNSDSQGFREITCSNLNGGTYYIKVKGTPQGSTKSYNGTCTFNATTKDLSCEIEG